jgi:formylglycine-generating enzyme
VGFGLMLTAALLTISCERKSATTARNPVYEFQSTIENRDPVTGVPPEGVVWIPGGEFSMGANDPPDMDEIGMRATTDARPIHRVFVDGFYMDKTDVTNAQFSEFVKATSYVTLAERTPRAEDFPGAPPENLVAGSVVFSPPNHSVPLNDHLQWWSYIKGANWRHPTGPDSDLRGKESVPVVQIAFEDAAAYAKWAGKRRPTKQSGHSQRVEVSVESRLHGEMSFVLAEYAITWGFGVSWTGDIERKSDEFQTTGLDLRLAIRVSDTGHAFIRIAATGETQHRVHHG